MAHIAILGAVVAHQGGWDEVLLVGAPIVIIVGVLAIAKRRVDRAHQQGAAGTDQQSETGRCGGAPPESPT